MKRLFFPYLLLILVAGCSPTVISPPDTSAPDTSPPVETSTPTTSEPEFIEVPLSYEVVGSYVREETITVHSSIEIGGIGSAEETREEIIFVACVEIKNTDSLSGTFKIVFSVEDPFLPLLLTQEFELAPSETITAECPAYSLGDWSYEVIPSIKLVER